MIWASSTRHRQSAVGKLDKAWEEAVTRGWIVVDMKADWRTVFQEVKP
jgi:hypothetical protein